MATILAIAMANLPKWPHEIVLQAYLLQRMECRGLCLHRRYKFRDTRYVLRELA